MNKSKLIAVILLVLAAALARTSPSFAEGGVPLSPNEGRAHVIFDDTTQPPRAGINPGGTPQPLTDPKRPLPARKSGSAAVGGGATSPPDPEVLGFAQAGEVSSGDWRNDLHLDLLSTVAYFGINVNGDGSFVTNDFGWQTWGSSQTTDLMNSAHSHGDRLVLTLKAFDTNTIASIVGDEGNRQRAISGAINQLSHRGGDGINIDFEGYSSSIASNFTTFMRELQSALNAQLPQSSYLTVDTYGSSAQGGTMMDIKGLSPYVDAFMVMAYDFTSPSSSKAGPTAPMNGYTYTDTSVTNDYLKLVPASQVILGVPYYGYKWSVANNGPQAPTQGTGTADTYSDALGDFSCAQQLSQHFDNTFLEPWATWYSPSTNDPCGGNHGAWRELYYDNAQSLGYKYDLVNNDHLRGIGIWALGYDSGTNDLWNEISAKFSVSHYTQIFVQRLYSDILGRAGDAQGIASWTRAIDNGESRYAVSLAFDSSDEFRNNAVTALYHIFLHRAPDAGGRQYFVQALDSGALLENVKAALAGSDEYYATRGGSSNDGFLNALYSDILHRSPDSSGRSYWDRQLGAGTARAWVAYSIAASDESYRDLVSTWYPQLLRRAIDSSGLNYWAHYMDSGGREEQVIAAITGSPEYFHYATTH
ncbi:MAG TPA: DUF4214 domain-containing protein [Candidatus Sulfotelmatobacter sp.]|nr:DUF4214 domain-containing protein [Candidatus Sulfotelmatobacter sp.]